MSSTTGVLVGQRNHTSQEVSCWRLEQFLAPHVRGVDSCGQQWWVTHWVA